MRSIRDHRPAEIRAFLDAVHFIPATCSVFGDPQLTVTVHRRALRVAMTVGPDLGLNACGVHERIVRRHSTGLCNAQDRSVVQAAILCCVIRPTIADRDEQCPVSRLHDARAEMSSPARPGRDFENRLVISECRTIGIEHRLGHRRAAGTTLPFGMGEEQRSALREITGHKHVKQAALPVHIHFGRRAQCHDTGTRRDEQNATVAFGHNDFTLWQKAKRPRLVEPGHHCRDLHLAGTRLDRFRRDLRHGRGKCCGRHQQRHGKCKAAQGGHGQISIRHICRLK